MPNEDQGSQSAYTSICMVVPQFHCEFTRLLHSSLRGFYNSAAEASPIIPYRRLACIEAPLFQDCVFAIQCFWRTRSNFSQGEPWIRRILSKDIGIVCYFTIPLRRLEEASWQRGRQNGVSWTVSIFLVTTKMASQASVGRKMLEHQATTIALML